MSYFDYDGSKIFYEEKGAGQPLILLHGNTMSGKMFAPLLSVFAEKYHVVALDFLGCGQSDRLPDWPADLWYAWSEQVIALCDYKGFEKCNFIGTSGGAIAAINVALEHGERVNAVVADSFEGIKADSSVTAQIRAGRNAAKQMEGFRVMLESVHGADWENVLDADTEAVVRHAETVGDFFHRPLSELKTRLLLTGSAEDEMFPAGHYQELFGYICRQTNLAKAHIFEHGGHPAMMSNLEEFISFCHQFLA